ncbi:hypothetical protein GGS21DRAFT_493752 [Xylaria nigripes]|nr:hypothetical protein GGS21DRAFT_493752 [Xylaria nigripes]
MSRVMLRTMQGLRAPLARLPPAFHLAPFRALSTTTPTRTPAPETPAAPPQETSLPTNPLQKFAPIPRSKKKTPISPPAALAAESIIKLLPLLRAQPRHYVTIHIHGFPYLVTPGDQIRLPFKMPGVVPGDVLRLDKASIIGSRDFTFKGSPWIDSSFFECRATVLGTESEPMRVKLKKKRRSRRAQRVTSKHKYTILCVNELKILDPSS